MTHCERVLELLADGQPHSYLEGYRLGVMLHSRVSDLRKRGHVIECWREGDNYLYRLLNDGQQGPSPEPIVEQANSRHHSPLVGASSLACSTPVQLRLVEAA